MAESNRSDLRTEPDASGRVQVVIEIMLLWSLFFVYAGDLPPMVNEAHYLVKAKNFWDPQWCQNDLFASSGKAHATFYALFGWPTLLTSLETTAWIGRAVGWMMLAFGLQRLSNRLLRRRYASLPVAVVWIAGIEYGNLAGEWVVGGIEAKVPAYGLLLLALSEIVVRRWGRVWILLGGAAAFHVLTGGWSVIAAMIAWWFTERGREDRNRLFTPSLLVGGCIALLGVMPALALTIGAGEQEATAAARIYTYYRIKHHLLPADFYPHWYLRHGAMIAGTLAMACFHRSADDRFRPIGWFTAATVMIGAVGLVLGTLPPVFPDFAAKMLRYYWFRLPDAVVPLMAALFVSRMIIHSGRLGRSIGILILVSAVLLTFDSSYRRGKLGVPPSVSNNVLGRDAGASADVQQKNFRDWLAVCRWARLSTDRDEVFLTPRHQQTFKWYAHRAEVVNWKDVPQDAASLLRWYRRFQEIFPRRLGHIRVTIQYDKLKEIRQKYGVNFMIVDRRVVGDSLPLVKVYPSGDENNATYAVYELPIDEP